jgi:hypothetical protein
MCQQTPFKASTSPPRMQPAHAYPSRRLVNSVCCSSTSTTLRCQRHNPVQRGSWVYGFQSRCPITFRFCSNNAHGAKDVDISGTQHYTILQMHAWTPMISKCIAAAKAVRALGPTLRHCSKNQVNRCSRQHHAAVAAASKHAFPSCWHA